MPILIRAIPNEWQMSKTNWLELLMGTKDQQARAGVSLQRNYYI